MKEGRKRFISENVLFIFLSSVIIILFYYRLFAYYNGYISFQNFVPNSQVYPNSFYFFSPFYAGGSPILEPLPNIIGDSELDFFRVLIGSLTGYNISIKLYIFFSTLFYIYSFFFLTGQLTKDFVARVISSVFYLLNPVTIVMLSYGDYSTFFGFSFFFIGIAFLIIFTKQCNNDLYLFISTLFLLFTIVSEQIFYLGIIIFILIGIFEILNQKTTNKIRKIVAFLGKYLFFLIVVSFMFILPLVFASFLSVLPTSPVAKPFYIFQSASLSVLKLLLLEGTGSLALSSVSLFGSIIATFWFALLSALVILLIFVSLISKNKQGFFLWFVVVISLLFGTGTLSPISPLLTWLYIHFPGYQLFPQSYLWDEIVIAPFLSLILAIVLTTLLNRTGGRDSSFNFSTKNYFLKRATALSKNYTFRKLIAMFLISITLLVAFLPVASQGYYNKETGINDENSGIGNQASLYYNLSNMVNNSDIGVAFFPGDPFVYFGDNHSNFLENILMLKPNYRVLNYVSGTPNLDQYYYWLYSEFYNNDTKYMPELFSTVGVKYFVVLNNYSAYGYGFLGEGVNVTKLMGYQENLRQLFVTKNYTVYQSTINIQPSVEVKNLTLVIGSFDILNYMAYSGINISNTPILFSSDINSKNYQTLSTMINRVVLENFSSLWAFYKDNFSDPTINPSILYDNMMKRIADSKVQLLEVFTPNSLVQTSSNATLVKIASNNGNVVPQGDLLFAQSFFNETSSLELDTGIKTGFLAISAVGISGSNFIVSGTSNFSIDYSTRFYTRVNATSGFIYDMNPISSNGTLNLYFVGRSYSLIPEILFSSEPLRAQYVSLIPNASFKQYQSDLVGELNQTHSNESYTLSGSITSNSSKPSTFPFFLSNVNLCNTKGIILSYNINGPVYFSINGVNFFNNGEFAINKNIMALKGIYNTGDQNLSIYFHYYGNSDNSTFSFIVL